MAAVSFAAMALLVAYAPDVWNTEKPMDMAIMNAIQVSPSFPPHDPWMAGETLNYYYLGHLLLAAPAHVLGLEPSVGYNLAVAGLFALCASARVHALGHAVGGRRDPRHGRAGGGRAGRRRAARSCSGTSPGRASGSTRRTRPATTTGSASRA